MIEPQKKETQNLEIRLLGAFRLLIGERIIKLRRKPAQFIKLLALQSNFRLHREQIVESLWANQNADAAVNNLHKTVHAVRRAFEPEIKSGSESNFLLTEDGQIILTAPRKLRVDVSEFEMLAALALKENDKKLLEDALEIYSGELLPEDLYEDWTIARRECLRLSRQHLLEKLGAIYERGGRFEESAVIFQKLIQVDELDESAHRNLMRVYALAGNRGRALKQFEICRDGLKKELNVAPERETVKLFEQIREEKFTARNQTNKKSSGLIINNNSLAEKSRTKTNLTTRLTSFIGRKKEIEEIKNLLETSRLITLTGTGGIGKTRLAQRIAAESTEKSANGAWFVELAALNDASLIPSAIADAIGANEKAGETIRETLRKFLREREMLIVLDNCEHFVAPCAEIAAKLLEDCPHLKILATSREALDAEGEIVWRVSALSLPEEIKSYPGLENLAENEAVKLFIERARLKDANFRLNEKNAAAIAEICRRLDGIPLALELAAARVRVISPEQIAARLDGSLQILISGGRNIAPRHQTLRAAIDWSYALLSENERRAWRVFSVFAGGFTLDTAEFVAVNLSKDAGVPALELLTGLTDKSIVSVAANNSETRYAMLETLRQYAAEKMFEQGEDEAVRAAHFDCFLKFAERAESKFVTPEKRFWLDSLEKEIDNLRLALEWAAENNAEKFLRLANALWHFWQSSGRLAEGRRHFENALSAGANAPGDLHAKALHRLGGLLVLECDFAGAARIYEKALELSRASDEQFLTARILANYGFALVNRGEYARAEKLHIEGLEIFRRLKDANGIAQISNGLGAIAYYQDDFKRATKFFSEALAIYRRTKNQLNVIGILQNLGSSAHLQNDLKAAEKYLSEGLQLAEDLGERRWINQTRHVLGYVYNDQKDYARAVESFTAALKLDPEIGGKDNIAHTFEGFACTAAALGDYYRSVKLLTFADLLREEIKTSRGKTLQNYFDRYMNAAVIKLTADEINVIKIECLSLSAEEMLAFALENQ